MPSLPIKPLLPPLPSFVVPPLPVRSPEFDAMAPRKINTPPTETLPNVELSVIGPALPPSLFLPMSPLLPALPLSVEPPLPV